MLIDLNSAFGIDNDPDQDAVTHIRAGTNTYDIHMRSIKGYDIVTVKYVNLADQRSESTSSIADSLMVCIFMTMTVDCGILSPVCFYFLYCLNF